MALKLSMCFVSVTVLLVCIVPAAVMAQQEAVTERMKVQGISSDKFTEFAPTISADGKTLIFESNKNKTDSNDDHWELFESRLGDNGQWSEPFPLIAINKKCNFLAGPSLSYDGNVIYFTAFIEGVTTSEDIFYSKRIDARTWSEPISVGAPVNTDEYEGFPSISANGNSLYFMRVNKNNEYDKKNKESCFTIYVSHKKSDDTWSEPIALPPSINSGCERDPKIMADNHTLIFSSIRANNKGKFDLYQTRLLPGNNWMDPVPLNFINSADNDQSPCIAASGDIMFFYSSNDIYSIGIPKEYRQMINVTVQGTVRTQESKTPVSAKIRITNTSNGEVIDISDNNPNDGNYSLVLNSGYRYRVDFINPSYQISSLDFDFSQQDRYLEISRDIDLESDYKIKVDIKDKDLGFLMTSHMRITDNSGHVVYNDSVRISDYPLELTLSTLKQYAIAANSPRYHPVSHTLTFDTSFTRQKPYSIALEHEKIEFIANVTDVSTKQKMKTKVHYNNMDRDEVIVADAGEKVYLRKGDRYQISTSSDRGYVFSSTTIVAGDISSENNGDNITLSVTPVREGVSLTLNYITFPSNSAELTSSSFVELERVMDLLTNNPNITIEISAHTDDVGDDSYNFNLSEKRARSVKAYLAKKIDAGRLLAKGYGETKPLVANDSELNRQLNRRVELIIVKVN